MFSVFLGGEIRMNSIVGISSYARAGQPPAFSIPTGYVDAVRRAMDEGRYHIDPQRVADKMMRFEVDLLATIPAHK